VSKETTPTIMDSLVIVWAIAAKDILDALKNRVVLSMMIMLSVILLVPKLLPFIFEQTQIALPIYDLGDSAWVTFIKGTPTLSVQELSSEQELRQALCGSIYPEIGLVLPPNFDQVMGEGNQVEFQGFACWSKRNQVPEVKAKLEGLLSQSLGKPVNINVEGNILYPPTDGGLYLSLATVNSLVMILMIGIFSVPNLLIEEKETKTMRALLVSPASISQVVIGKSLAGLINILVCAVLIFIISWVDVIHWDMVILFVIGSGIFSVALGLLLGSLFDRQVDMIGWITAILLALVGAVVIKALSVDLPYLVREILPWVPSVALSEIYRAAISETISFIHVWTAFGSVLAISLVLYVLVTFIIRRQQVR